MKEFKNIVLLILMAFVFSGCTTQTTSSNPIDRAEEECIAKTSSTYEMNRCSVIAQKKWEQEIQNNLDTLKKNLTEDDYAVIEKSQQAWNEYKIAEYELIDKIISYKQGTMYSNVREGLRTDILKQRALKLKEYINIYSD